MKKTLPIFVTLLTLVSCRNLSSGNSNTERSDFEFPPFSSQTTESSTESSLPDVESSDESSVSTSVPFDEFAGLSNDARKVAEDLKNNESRDNDSYFKITMSFYPGGVSLTRKFTYYIDEQLFETAVELRDTEDDVVANGYVTFAWGSFLEGYFGGSYRSGNYYIVGMQFYEMGRNGLNFSWSKATYRTTNFPDPDSNSNVIAGFDLAFDCIQEGILYAAEYLEQTFTPSLYLF